MKNEKRTVQVPQRRAVAFVDETMFVPGHGYRVALVFEGEDGYRPTGTWPYNGGVGEVMPWFWGDTIEKARTACDSYNERFGIPREEAWAIVARSMAGGRRGNRG